MVRSRNTTKLAIPLPKHVAADHPIGLISCFRARNFLSVDAILHSDTGYLLISFQTWNVVNEVPYPNIDLPTNKLKFASLINSQ